ncbi:MAG: winged helix-turn-helix domain-containing protein [Dehalococcoidia bacterium]|nr:winged helix-turn-helix domain-containing protein [Dehalococcoidia bacterium]
MGRKPQVHGWSLLSSRGSVLFFIALHPDSTINDIAGSLSLTRRAVWGVLGDLRRAGLLRVGRGGREHRYSVDPDGPFLHPTIKDVPVRVVLEGVAPRPGARDGASRPGH